MATTSARIDPGRGVRGISYLSSPSAVTAATPPRSSGLSALSRTSSKALALELIDISIPLTGPTSKPASEKYSVASATASAEGAYSCTFSAVINDVSLIERPLADFSGTSAEIAASISRWTSSGERRECHTRPRL